MSSLTALLLCIAILCLHAQFLTKKEYERMKRLEEKPELRVLEELEKEVRVEGYSIYKDPNINTEDEQGLTKLLRTVKRGDKDATKHVIVQGADLDVRDPNGDTALMIAVQEGNYYPTVELLKGHANTLAKNRFGMNALHIAIAKQQSILVEAILMQDLSFREGVWASKYAKRESLVNSQIDRTGMTALMMACQDGMDDTALHLIRHGADLNMRSKTGETALMYAAIAGNAPLVGILMKQGADASLRNYDLFSALMMAANRGHKGVVNKLLSHCDDDPDKFYLNLPDRVGNTALDHAIMKGEQAVVDALMAAGATSQMSAIVGPDVMEMRWKRIENREKLREAHVRKQSLLARNEEEEEEDKEESGKRVTDEDL